MYVIEKDCENEIIIKNSRFITILIKINGKDKVNSFLQDIKIKYPKATHYCYGYIINDYKKSSDDGEPSGTAGIPILNVLEKENITNVLTIVVRYFGGIKLGAGGLVRAYSKGVRELLKTANLIELVNGKKIEINFNYSDEKNINYILKEEQIIKKDYSDKVTYIALIKDNILEKLKNFNYKVLEDTYIEKRS